MPCESWPGRGVEEAKAETDLVTRLLCEVLRALDRFPLTSADDPRELLSGQVHEWWEQHQREDRSRARSEARAARIVRSHNKRQ